MMEKVCGKREIEERGSEGDSSERKQDSVEAWSWFRNDL